jgi:octaprenyl-diphosphate synthase
VDASELRRGRETANALFGNEASVLVGDFLYSRAFQMMVDVNDMRVMAILANATNVIAEGEVMQLLNCNDADTTEERYLHVIRSKTAKLFEAAAQLGAIVAARPREEEQALAAYGMHLGTAFQIIDDVLDYQASPEQTGKNIGDDLAEGKPTLPLIYAMRAGNPEQRQIVRHAIEAGGREHIDAVMTILRATGAIQYAAQIARQEADRAMSALTALANNEYKDALLFLARFSVERNH